MTELTIIPNFEKKTAKFKGVVAAGEKIRIVIDGGITLGDGVRLRAVGIKEETLARFPEKDGDSWESLGEGKYACTFNLNTVQMLEVVPSGAVVPIMFVLDDEENDTLYFKGFTPVVHWPKIPGEDVPYDLSNFPRQIDEWEAQLSNMEVSVERVSGGVKITAWDGKGEKSEPVVVHDGAKGDTGPKGDKGDDGLTPDLSAYRPKNDNEFYTEYGDIVISSSSEAPQEQMAMFSIGPYTDEYGDDKYGLDIYANEFRSHAQVLEVGDLLKITALPLEWYEDDWGYGWYEGGEVVFETPSQYSMRFFTEDGESDDEYSNPGITFSHQGGWETDEWGEGHYTRMTDVWIDNSFNVMSSGVCCLDGHDVSLWATAMVDISGDYCSIVGSQDCSLVTRGYLTDENGDYIYDEWGSYIETSSMVDVTTQSILLDSENIDIYAYNYAQVAHRQLDVSGESIYISESSDLTLSVPYISFNDEYGNNPANIVMGDESFSIEHGSYYAPCSISFNPFELSLRTSPWVSEDESEIYGDACDIRVESAANVYIEGFGSNGIDMTSHGGDISVNTYNEDASIKFFSASGRYFFGEIEFTYADLEKLKELISNN